jgi:CheY-like chemotaxis protein
MAKKILIVDDEPDVVTYLSTFFKDNGYEVVTAANGKEAYEKAVSEMPDLITLDITMPEESGVRCFRDLQENEKTQNIPVIIVTGVSGEFKRFIETRRQVQPPVSYFEKPIDRTKLLEKIEEII